MSLEEFQKIAGLMINDARLKSFYYKIFSLRARHVQVCVLEGTKSL